MLENKVAIITGAAMGMGKATALIFAEAKAKIMIADLNEEKGNETVEEIKKNGGEAIFLKLIFQTLTR